MSIRRKTAAAALAVGLSFAAIAAPAMAKGGSSGSGGSGKCKVIGVDPVTGEPIISCGGGSRP